MIALLHSKCWSDSDWSFVSFNTQMSAESELMRLKASFEKSRYECQTKSKQLEQLKQDFSKLNADKQLVSGFLLLYVNSTLSFYLLTTINLIFSFRSAECLVLTNIVILIDLLWRQMTSLCTTPIWIWCIFVGWRRVGCGNAWLIFQQSIANVYFVIMTVTSANLCRCGYDFVQVQAETAIMQYSLVFTISL